MEKPVKTVSISFEEDYLKLIITDCVNSCLKHQPQSNTPQPEADQLLTIQQAAEFLNLSVSTLYGYTQRKEIPVCKRSKRLYFSKQELTDWIKASRKKTASEIAAEADQYLTKKKK